MTTLPDKEIVHTEEELMTVIRKFYPKGTDAEHNLMKLSLILQSRGKSLADVLPKSEGSPFIKLASR